MRHIFLLTITIMINSANICVAHANTLNDMQWKNRVIVAFGSEASDGIAVFKESVVALTCELTERDVNVYWLDKMNAVALTNMARLLDASSINTIQTLRENSDFPFEMILIGKDGGIKFHSTDPAALPIIIRLIDGMPMRRAEAALNGGDC